jgi:hypothetical protein
MIGLLAAKTAELVQSINIFANIIELLKFLLQPLFMFHFLLFWRLLKMILRYTSALRNVVLYYSGVNWLPVLSRPKMCTFVLYKVATHQTHDIHITVTQQAHDWCLVGPSPNCYLTSFKKWFDSSSTAIGFYGNYTITTNHNSWSRTMDKFDNYESKLSAKKTRQAS